MNVRTLSQTTAIATIAVLALSLTPARAADVLVTHRLSSGLATDIAVRAVAECVKLTFVCTAAVVDSDGVTQALVRGDGAGIHTVQGAHDKAYTAVTYGRPGSETQKVYVSSPPSGVILKEPYLLPGDGGLPIKIGNEVVAALGISGTPGKDEVCGHAALDAFSSRLK
jgi:uncharacterized protein GlcG (DUF336 family)